MMRSYPSLSIRTVLSKSAILCAAIRGFDHTGSPLAQLLSRLILCFMNRLWGVVLAVGFASSVLTGCSQTKDAPPGPSSSILPAVTFPAGSKLSDSEKSTSLAAPGNLESWDVPLSFDQVRDSLKEQLPIGRSFAGAPYEGEDAGVDKFGNETITWNWGDDTKLVSVIAGEYQPKRDGHVHVVIGVFSEADR